MAVYEVELAFGDPESPTLIVEAEDELQAAFIASTMIGSPKVIEQMMIYDNMKLDVRPLAAVFEATWPKLTVTEQK